MKKAIANWLNDHIAEFLQYTFALMLIAVAYIGLLYCALYVV